MQRDIANQIADPTTPSRPAHLPTDLSARAAAAIAEPGKTIVYASVHGHAQAAIVRRPATGSIPRP